MPRLPSVRYFESRQAYYTQYRGRQHLLAAGPADGPDGPTYKKAVERFYQIIHAEQRYDEEDNATVGRILIHYFHSLKLAERFATLEKARHLLDPAIEQFGHVKVKELKPFVVKDWLAERETWGATTKSIALDFLKTAFGWATKDGRVNKNPLEGMDRLPKRSRGKETVLPPSLRQAIMDSSRPALRKVLQMLNATGARPGEILHADCKHYRPDIVPALILPGNPADGDYAWKNAKRTGKDRVIFLTPPLQKLIEGEIGERGGKGRIFRTERGDVWRSDNFNLCFWRLRKHRSVRKAARQTGVEIRTIIPYSFRHTYATEQILAGCPIKLLADFMGTSIAMIEKHYGHAADDLLAMRKLFVRFNCPGLDSESAPSPQDKSS